MKKTKKYIALLLAVILLMLSVSSCGLLRELTNAEQAVALYKVAHQKTTRTSSLACNSKVVFLIDSIDVNDVRSTTTAYQATSNAFSKNMKHYLKTETKIESLDEKGKTIEADTSYVIEGYADGKMFYEDESGKKFFSELSREDYIEHISGEESLFSDIKAGDFEIASAQKDEDEEWVIKIEGPLGKSKEDILSWLGSSNRIDTKFIELEFFSIELDLDDDNTIETEKTNIKYSIVQNFKKTKYSLTIEEDYSELDKEENIEIPAFDEYTAVSDLRLLDDIEDAYSDMYLKKSGRIEYIRTSKNEKDSTPLRLSDVGSYSEVDGKLSFSIRAEFLHSGERYSYTAKYSKEKFSISGNKITPQTTTMSEVDAYNYIFQNYFSIVKLDRSLIKDFSAENIGDEAQQKRVVINLDLRSKDLVYYFNSIGFPYAGGSISEAVVIYVLDAENNFVSYDFKIEYTNKNVNHTYDIAFNIKDIG